MDWILRQAIRDRLVSAIPELRVALYLPIAIPLDGSPAIPLPLNSVDVRSAVIDRSSLQLTSNHTGRIEGTAEYRVWYALGAQAQSLAVRHAEFHSDVDAILAALLIPQRFGLDEADPRTNMLRRVDQCSVTLSLGESTSASSRQHVLTAEYVLSLSIYWQPEVS